MSHWCGRVVVLLATVVTCVGCLTWEPRDTGGVTIVNDTSETVTVVVLYPEPAGESALNTYRPGGSSVENNMLNREDGCTRFTMVRTGDGHELDCESAPIRRDEEWRIGP